MHKACRQDARPDSNRGSPQTGRSTRTDHTQHTALQGTSDLITMGRVTTILSLLVVMVHIETGVSLLESTAPALDRVHTSGDHDRFVDSHGRVRTFHGVNAVSKQFPWYRDFLLNDTRLDDLQKWGLNVVRLGTMWAGAEPARGSYNHTYINILQTIVKKLSARGIYTILDMHQDCLTSKYQAYDGVPRWLVDTFPEPTNPFPWPLESIGGWEEKYLTQAVSEAFQHLYNNVSNSVEQWAAFWGLMAKTFTGDPAVLGYNLINEPWIGDFYQNLTLAYPGQAGSANLLPVYDVINEKIRQHDSEGIVFYEPVFYGQVGHGKWLGAGFERVPGGATYQNVSAYSFHMYCWLLEFMVPDASEEQRKIARDHCYQKFLPQIVASSEWNVKLTGGARMVTEFGLCKTGKSEQINVKCDFLLDLCDKYMLSWVEWDYNNDQWYTDGQPLMDKVRPHVRPYARAVAGVPSRMRFNSTSRDFRLEFVTSPSITEPTEIFIPELVYQGDVVVSLQGPLRYSKPTYNMVHVHTTGNNTQPEQVTVTISPMK